MTYKVADKLGVERKSWKTAFLTSIYNETATVHGRIDRSESMGWPRVHYQAVHGRIDRSEIEDLWVWFKGGVHGRIDRSESTGKGTDSDINVHDRIDRSEMCVPLRARQERKSGV